MNEMSRLAERLGADIEQVRMGIGADPRIGTHFLYAGCGWGGSCFPKDVQALARMGQDSGLDLQIVGAVREVNEQQKRLLAQRIRHRYGDDLRGLTFGVWGLSFKPDTDDLREAPSLLLIDELLQCGATVRAFDPVAMPGVAALWPDRPRLTLCDDPLSAADGASALAIVTEWREFRSPDFGALMARMKTPVLLDGRNLYDPGLMLQLGFEHLGIGRGSVDARWARLPEERLQALAA
jgi:UDPglucose 6-dehydrogenase